MYPHQKRDREILDDYLQGTLPTELADSYKLTYQRIWQVLKDQGAFPELRKIHKEVRAKAETARRDQELQDLRERKPTIVALYRDGMSIQKISETQGIPHRTLTAFFKSENITREFVVFKDKELLTALRTVSNKSTLTIFEYSRASYRDKSLPCVNTFYRRFGSWNNALIKAGLETTLVVPGQHTEESLVNAILKVAKQIGHVPSSYEYYVHTGNDPNFPSRQTFQYTTSLRRDTGWAYYQGLAAEAFESTKSVH